MEDRFSQQMKKGALEMLTLSVICLRPTYGYALLAQIRERSGGFLTVKEGTLYPILYRLEDEGLIQADWSQGEGRTAPKKIYTATPEGQAENKRRQQLWRTFEKTIDIFLDGGEPQ